MAAAERARPRESWQHLQLLPLSPRLLLSPTRAAPPPLRRGAREGEQERAHVTPGNHGNPASGRRTLATETAAGLRTLARAAKLVGRRAPARE